MVKIFTTRSAVYTSNPSLGLGKVVSWARRLLGEKARLVTIDKSMLMSAEHCWHHSDWDI